MTQKIIGEFYKADGSGWGGCPANGFWKVPWLTQHLLFFSACPKWSVGDPEVYMSGEGGWGGCHARLLPENVFINSWHLLCVSIIIVDCFYIALFSALKQTHHALVTCDSEWVTFYKTFWTAAEVVDLQHCSLVAWLMLYDTGAVSEHILCTSHNHAPVYNVTSFAPVYNVTSFKTTYAWCMCV